MSPSLWYLAAPAGAWLRTLTVTPEARAALLAPTTTLNRVTVIWLLLAPVVTAILWIYLPLALPFFFFPTTFFDAYFGWKIRKYWSDIIRRLYPSDDNTLRQENENTRNVTCPYCSAGWNPLDEAERHIAKMRVCKDKEIALLYLKKTKEAYTGMVKELHPRKPSPLLPTTAMPYALNIRKVSSLPEKSLHLQ